MELAGAFFLSPPALFLFSPVAGPQPKKKGAITKIKQVMDGLLFMLQ